MSVNLAKAFEFLDDLRASGVTNMYGAGPYVEDSFDIDRNEAREIVLAWMKTYSAKGTPAERAAKVRP